jgi:hypothetical protein
MVIIDIAIISLSGILAFSGSSEIARARYTGTTTTRSLELSRKGAPILLAVGVGVFLLYVCGRFELIGWGSYLRDH